ncbi:alkylation response protein AidB-like acyl-CoA dehydrogenase [Leucobacter exalbidus]|uniref:Alkylation response protein AidB-like acyl-CoA dehydrogenase n=1 Tax=Leucobacter exalbidus TaxID=662960 RepID=A0A940PVI0_9MICO|nr:acyl-CoA dehydrogenase family protein [Leucobacter exalbidus]MBP1325971.1 alkylation response protein AidB-like acyl-CoA dehydrogenase [Leucobacter exalbidus]
MEFMHSEEQLAFADAIDDIVTDLGGTQLARSWAAGDTAPGLALWAQFAELGLTGLRIAEADGGMGGSLADLAVVFERFGYHAVPGPYVESLALLPQLVSDADRAAIAGGAVATAAVAGTHPHLLDAHVAALQFSVTAGALATATAGEALESIASFRKLSRATAGADAADVDPDHVNRAIDEATLANAAMLIGAGERLLHEAVEYAKMREQFGKAIGEYQSLKHQLADVRIALSFARPLVWQAALALESGAATAGRDVSAAKVRAAAAAQLAARVSLQVHGAIGYTAEHDLSLWLTWVPALVGAWGTPAQHRARIADSILAPVGGAA